MRGYNLTFDPLKINQSRASEVSFFPIKNFDSCHKCFNRRHTSDYPMNYKEQLLIICTCKKEWHLIGASLSEPHTSVTALQDVCVCMSVCLRT